MCISHPFRENEKNETRQLRVAAKHTFASSSLLLCVRLNDDEHLGLSVISNTSARYVMTSLLPPSRSLRRAAAHRLRLESKDGWRAVKVYVCISEVPGAPRVLRKQTPRKSQHRDMRLATCRRYTSKSQKAQRTNEGRERGWKDK